MADRKSRKEELLAAARDRLSEESARQNEAADTGPELRYRGQLVKPSTARTPGSGSRAASTPRGGGGNDDVRAALEQIKALYRDGLISRAEAEKKRSDILDRL